jgi:hypothetical protein
MTVHRFIVITMAAIISMQSFAASKAPAAKDTIVLQRVRVAGTDRELGMGSGEADQRSGFGLKLVPGTRLRT